MEFEQEKPISTIKNASTQASSDTFATKPGDAFQAAVNKFRVRLSAEENSDFQETTYEQLCQTVFRIQQEQEYAKSMMNLNRIQSCIEALNEFGKVVEVFLNVSYVSFVWGPIKFLLLVRSQLLL